MISKFEEPVLGHFGFFKDGNSKPNNHSPMTVGKLFLALSDQFRLL